MSASLLGMSAADVALTTQQARDDGERKPHVDPGRVPCPGSIVPLSTEGTLPDQLALTGLLVNLWI